ncbi:MAG TPA: anion permease [Actinomycetota bacterium]
MPDARLLSVILIVCVAVLFDYSNGFHDAANSIATVVSTRVLTPRIAVIWAAAFNFLAFLVFHVLFHTSVANTVGKSVSPAIVSEAVVFAGLAGAVIWNFTTWWFGLPTSSSHALIGGFVGAGVAKAGWHVVNSASLRKTVLFIVLSPLFGLVFAFLLMFVLMWVFHRSSPRRVDRLFRRLQLFSAAAFSLGHGGNDAQKTMGVVSALLVGAGYLHLNANGDLPLPFWVVLLAYAAIAAGTATGGWRIVKTLGQKITALKPIGGFSAETAAAISIYIATFLGIPVSTTHTITGAIVGAGSTRRLSAVRWGVAGRIVWAWIITIPAAGALAAVAYWLVAQQNHLIPLLALAALLVLSGALVAARRTPQPSAEPGTGARVSAGAGSD